MTLLGMWQMILISEHLGRANKNRKFLTVSSYGIVSYVGFCSKQVLEKHNFMVDSRLDTVMGL